MLLFRFVGKGFQLALCNVSWLATQESVVLVHDPIVFAPWSVFLDRGEPCDSCQGTSDEAVFFRIGESDVCRQPIAGMGQWTPPLVVVLCSLFLPHAPSQVHRNDDLGDEADGMKGDTVELLDTDDVWPERGALWNSRKTGVTLEYELLIFPLQTGNLIASAERKRRRRLQWAPEAVER